MHDSTAFEHLAQHRQPVAASRSYVAAWVTLAVLSIGYASLMATRPEMLAEYVPMTRSDGVSSGVDVATMRSTIAQLNAELAEAKTAAATSAAQVGVLTQRISEIEARGTPVASAPAAAAPAPAVATGEAPASALARKFAEAKPAADAVKPQIVAKAPTGVVGMPAAEEAARAIAASGQLETGSLSVPKSAAGAPAAAPVSFGPAVVTPAAQPFGIEIGRAASVDELRLSWSLLQEQHSASLKNLGAHYAAASDAADAPLNLVAGPIKSRGEAVRVCKVLMAKGVACKIGAFAGEPL